ncbi:MAG: hypothetical protein QM496_11045 [Verrucomicrobiota bacterium]
MVDGSRLVGVTLFTGPIWGFALTAYGMVGAFNALEEPSAEAISQNVGIALEAAMIGILTGSVGALLILLAFFGFKNRERWFYQWSVTIALGWSVMTFPLGWVFALPIIVMFLSKRVEFRKLT